MRAAWASCCAEEKGGKGPGRLEEREEGPDRKCFIMIEEIQGPFVEKEEREEWGEEEQKNLLFR